MLESKTKSFLRAVPLLHLPFLLLTIFCLIVWKQLLSAAASCTQIADLCVAIEKAFCFHLKIRTESSRRITEPV